VLSSLSTKILMVETAFYICGDKNCNNKRVAVYGQCIGFNTGVWVQAGMSCRLYSLMANPY
jgi:hypothetical protein